MDDRSTPNPLERPRGSRRLRLWHLAVAVLVAALLFGGTRAFLVAVGRSVAETLLVGSLFLVALALLVASFVAGARFGNHVGLALLGWGERLGGLAGSVAPALAVLAYLLAGFAATMIGVVAVAVLVGLVSMLQGSP